MKKVVRAVAIGVGFATIILTVLKIMKTNKKGQIKAPKFYAENDNEALGI